MGAQPPVKEHRRFQPIHKLLEPFWPQGRAPTVGGEGEILAAASTASTTRSAPQRSMAYSSRRDRVPEVTTDETSTRQSGAREA